MIFRENPSSGSGLVPCGQTNGQTDRQTERQTDKQLDGQTDRQLDGQTDGHREEGNSRFLQFCERT